MEWEKRAKHGGGEQERRGKNKGNGRQKANFKEEKMCKTVVILKVNGLNFPI